MDDTSRHFPFKARRFGRLVITTMLQAHGAPIVDRCWTRDLDGREYRGRAIVWPIGGKDAHGDRKPHRALVVGWRR